MSLKQQGCRFDPGLGTQYSAGQPKEERKKKKDSPGKVGYDIYTRQFVVALICMRVCVCVSF